MRLKPVRSMWVRKLNVAILLLVCNLYWSPLISARPWSPRAQPSHSELKPSRDTGLDFWQILRKRGCHLGLACTYSHLSSIAAERTLQKMMVDYMHNCVNDPRCSPGRRKRQLSVLKKSKSLSPQTDGQARGLHSFRER